MSLLPMMVTLIDLTVVVDLVVVVDSLNFSDFNNHVLASSHYPYFRKPDDILFL